MFDMGLWEMLLIGVIALIVVGPERLPRLARTAGLWIGKARSMVASVRDEVERELKVEELKRSIHKQTDSEEFRKLADQVKSINSDVRSTEQSLRSDIDRGTRQVGEQVKSPAEPKTSRTAAEPTDGKPAAGAPAAGTPAAASSGDTPGSEPAVSAEQSSVPPATPRQDQQPAEADSAASSTRHKTG